MIRYYSTLRVVWDALACFRLNQNFWDDAFFLHWCVSLVDLCYSGHSQFVCLLDLSFTHYSSVTDSWWPTTKRWLRSGRNWRPPCPSPRIVPFDGCQSCESRFSWTSWPRRTWRTTTDSCWRRGTSSSRFCRCRSVSSLRETGESFLRRLYRNPYLFI